MAKSTQSKKISPSGSDAVDALMAGLDHPFKTSIQDIRALIVSLDPRIKEEVKWNAPSFFIDDHFATFRLQPPSAIQLILHTGAKVKANPKPFKISDPHKLLAWPAKDRSVLTLRTAEEAVSRRAEVAAIVAEWIKQLD
jgi:hypothetical protein